MKTLRQGIALSSVLAAGLALGACSTPQAQENPAAADSKKQSVQETCKRIEPAMTDLMTAAKKGPSAGQEIVDSFQKLNDELTAASKDASDGELKTGLSNLAGSITKYSALIEQLKSDPQEAQKNLASVVSELGTNGSKVGQICKDA